METLAISTQPALARRLGDTVHVSPLLHRLCKISGCKEDRIGEWLLKCAIERGASHYARGFPGDLPPDCSKITNEEIGVGLCLGQHPYNSTYLRAAAQLLSSPNTDPGHLARLALLERVEPALLHIAAVAARFASEDQPWLYLRSLLTKRLTYHPDALPHWSRFVSQTGVTSLGRGPDIKWLRRRESA